MIELQKATPLFTPSNPVIDARMRVTGPSSLNAAHVSYPTSNPSPRKCSRPPKKHISSPACAPREPSRVSSPIAMSMTAAPSTRTRRHTTAVQAAAEKTGVRTGRGVRTTSRRGTSRKSRLSRRLPRRRGRNARRPLERGRRRRERRREIRGRSMASRTSTSPTSCRTTYGCERREGRTSTAAFWTSGSARWRGSGRVSSGRTSSLRTRRRRSRSSIKSIM